MTADTDSPVYGNDDNHNSNSNCNDTLKNASKTDGKALVQGAVVTKVRACGENATRSGLPFEGIMLLVDFLLRKQSCRLVWRAGSALTYLISCSRS
jgi:hypothetical protein